MELSNNTISKVLIECLTNKILYRLVKTNISGFTKFSNSHKDIYVFTGLIEYIRDTEFDEFNSISLNSKLRDRAVSEGTLSDLLSSIDYLRSVNADKPILPETVTILKSIFYSGHYDEVKGKSYSDIFEYCRSVNWVSDYVDSRFVIEDISSNFDVDKVSALLSNKNSIKSSFKFINDSSPIEGYFPNELVTLTAAPGVGKTQACFTEAINFIKQGKRVLYIAMGDMVNYFITIRLMCMYMKISQAEAYMNLNDNLNEFRLNKDVKDNFKFVVLKSGAYTATEVFNFLNTVQDTFDVFMIDYDGNFNKQSESMYAEGGDTYDQAVNLCREFNKLGFILSQPKIAYWAVEALGLECLAESSRKQQITDTIITFGRRQGVSNRCGLAQIVKGRNRDLVFRVPWAGAESGQSMQITQDMYGELINSEHLIKLKINDQGTLDLPDEYLELGT